MTLMNLFCSTSVLYLIFDIIFMPSLKKGAYCFCNCQSLGRSVDQVLSTQYLLSPSLDQTWAGVVLHEQMIPFDFQITGHRSNSNHSFEPSVLSTLYILIPCLLLQTDFASTEKINLNFEPWGAYMFLKHFFFSFKYDKNKVSIVGFFKKQNNEMLYKVYTGRSEMQYWYLKFFFCFLQ